MPDVILQLVHRQRGIAAIAEASHLVAECPNRSRGGHVAKRYSLHHVDVMIGQEIGMPLTALRVHGADIAGLSPMRI